MFDYHVHTSFSADSQEPVESYLNELQARGITEFCVTEHMAVNFHRGNWMVDLDAYVPKIRALQAAGYPVILGIEADVNCAACDVEELVTQLSRYPLDFVLVSSHCFMGSDPYQEDMFQNRDAIAVCRSYLQDLYTCLRRIDPALFSALAHLDYLAKGFGATYLPGGLFRYEYAPDELDAVMRYAIEHGRCIEINTSCPQSLRGDNAPVLGWLRRYRELGSEFVTLGSDAHQVRRFGENLDLAKARAKQAGIRYIAAYTAMQPELHPIDD